MVKIQIDVDEELNVMVMKDMYDHKEECKNEDGNIDKRIAIVRILKEHFESLYKK